MKEGIFYISASQAGDYFQFYCSNCKNILTWKYLGLDPSIPHFEFSCPECKSSIILKNDNFIVKSK